MDNECLRQILGQRSFQKTVLIDSGEIFEVMRSLLGVLIFITKMF